MLCAKFLVGLAARPLHVKFDDLHQMTAGVELVGTLAVCFQE